MNTETSLLPPMQEWIMRRRLSARFYALVLAGAGAASAESLPSCSLDSLAPMLESAGTVECVVNGGSDTIFVWHDEEKINWFYNTIGAEWVTDGRLVWGIHQDARLYPSERWTREQYFVEPSGDDWE